MITIEDARQLAQLVAADERIIGSVEPGFTHLFFVPDTHDPHMYVNSVLAWAAPGPFPGIQVHYPSNENSALVAVLVRFNLKQGFGQAFDMQVHLQKLGLITEYARFFSDSFN